MSASSFRYPGTVQMLEDLYARHGVAADVASAVDSSRWHNTYLSHLPTDVSARIYVEANDAISRAMLRQLAAQSRAQPEDDHRLSDLFFNILAWGISGDWRRVGTIIAEFAARPNEVLAGLRAARDASFAGRLSEAYQDVDHLLPKWGPAFMTKFLAFTSDPVESDRPAAITVDSRVELAWQVLIGPEGALPLNAKRFAALCSQAQILAHQAGWTADDLEQRLFVFGQVVGSYARWGDAELRALRGPTPTLPATEIFTVLNADR